jgi:hypothetical protein
MLTCRKTKDLRLQKFSKVKLDAVGITEGSEIGRLATVGISINTEGPGLGCTSPEIKSMKMINMRFRIVPEQ